MKQIPLSKGRAFALVDDADYDYLMQWKWNFANSNGYALRYWTDGDQRGAVYMHRAIMKRMLGHDIPKGLQVDHIAVGAESRLDNRRSNLRTCTRSQNQWHKNRPSHSSTGYKGVSLDNGKFNAYIKKHGKRIYLGRFEHAEEAALMYDRASQDLHGEFSKPNFQHSFIPPHLEERWQKILKKRQNLK